MNNIKVVVFRFRMGDVEDPQIFAAEPLYEWENSEAGKWVIKNSVKTPSWHIVPNIDFYGNDIIVTAEFKPKEYTYWKLKYE